MSRSWISNFTTLVFVCLYLAATGAALYFGPSYLANNIVKTETERSAKLGLLRVIRLLEDNKKAFETAQLTDQDVEALTHFVLSSDVSSLRLFNEQGELFWASGNENAQNITNELFFKHTLAHGGVVQKIIEKKAADLEGFQQEHIGESYDDNSLRLVSEIHIPVLHNGEVHGVVGTFRDISDSLAIAQTRLTIAGSLIATALTLTILIALTSSIRFRRRTEQMVEIQRNKEKAIMERDLQRNREIRLLSQLSEWMQASKSMEELFDMATNILTRLLPNCSGSIYVYSNSRDVLEGACSWNGAHHQDEISPDDCWGLRRGRAYIHGLDEIDFACSHNHGDQDHIHLCIPIVAHGDTIGLLNINLGDLREDETAVSKATKLAQTCAEQLSLAIANVRLRDELRNQSIRDPLTRLYNRRHFFESCRNQITASHRKSQTFSITCFDIDHFKLFNDNHGHDAGDMVLRAVGDCLLQEFDGNDLVFRMGGEEFTIILDNTNQQEAFERIEKLRKKIETLVIHYGEGSLPRITISSGIALFPTDGEMPQHLMKIADKALYEAKANGRNCTILASQMAEEEANPVKALQNRVTEETTAVA